MGDSAVERSGALTNAARQGASHEVEQGPEVSAPAADATGRAAGTEGPNGPVDGDAQDTPHRRRDTVVQALGRIVEGMRDADPAMIEAAAVELSGKRRWLAPLGYVAGTLALVASGVKPLIANWRLTLIEVAPAAWIWLSIWNLKAHFLDERSVHPVHGWVLIPLAAAIVAVAIAAFFCNAIFAFAIGGDPPPRIRPAMAKARESIGLVLCWGILFGIAQAAVLLWVSRYGKFWYDLSLSIVVVGMMVSFVAVPAAILGKREQRTNKERVGYAAVGGALSAIAATPGFLFDRIGLLMIGVHALRIPGFALLSVGVALQVAGTSSVKAVKLSTRLSAPGEAGA
jgi:hypothetical protein